MANVSHASLTGSDLHEPKGTAAAAADKVYVSNGAGSGTWQKVTNTQTDGNVGNLVLINSQELGVATSAVSFVNGVSGVVLDGTYNSYLLDFNNIFFAGTGGNRLMLQVGTGAGPTWQTTNYGYCVFHLLTTGGSGVATSTISGGGGIALTATGSDAPLSGISTALCGQIWFHNPEVTDTKIFKFDTTHAGLQGPYSSFGHGAYTPTSAISGIRLTPVGTSNNFTGNFALYGLRK